MTTVDRLFMMILFENLLPYFAWLDESGGLALHTGRLNIEASKLKVWRSKAYLQQVPAKCHSVYFVFANCVIDVQSEIAKSIS